MITEMGIVHGNGCPRINASIPELMNMDLPLFLHIRDQLGDVQASWRSSRPKK